MRIHLLAVAAAASLLAACGDEVAVDLDNPGGLVGAGGASGGSGGVHCLFTTGGSNDVCEQATGTMDQTKKDEIAALCSADGGAYSAGGCPVTGSVGYCEYADAAFGWSVTGGTLRKYYYSAGGWDATSAAADCTGSWNP